MSNSSEASTPPRRGLPKGRLVILGVVAVGILGLFYAFGGSGDEAVSAGTTYTVARGDLEINVLEGGSIQALRSQQIRSEVEGSTKILSIVEEGSLITQDDVDAGMVLVELDSSQLEDKLTNQRIQYQSSQAAYIEEQQDYEIQISENESSIKSAELVVKFAQLEFEKFLGASAVNSILSELGLDVEAERIKSHDVVAAAANAIPDLDAIENDTRELTSEGPIELNDALIEALVSAVSAQDSEVQPERIKLLLQSQQTQSGELSPAMVDRMSNIGVDVYEIARSVNGPLVEIAEAPQENAATQSSDTFLDEIPMENASNARFADVRDNLDFTKYADMALLEDGAAKQQLRKLEDDVLVAEEEYQLAQTQLEGTQRLAERDFVTQTELDREKVAVNKSQIQLESAKSARELYMKYEFPKQAEQLLSDYEDALRQLERSQKQAVNQLTQLKARLRSREAQYRIDSTELRDIQDQIAACTIRAERPGLVVYGDGENERWRNDEQIDEGTSVRERQTIMIIPDMSEMAVEVKVHESAVEKVARGQMARVRVESRADRVLEGEVIKVGVLPDSQSRWANPDLKVFSTMVKITTVEDWLRPGMSAQVEILVDKLTDVLYVPLQAVYRHNGGHIVYVASGGETGPRNVDVGAFNDEFVEIVGGVKEGEVIYLRPPDSMRLEDSAEPGASGGEGDDVDSDDASET